MPYPYTLMPDGQTLEPEEEQEPEPSNEGTPAEPESGPKPPPGIDIPGYTPTPGYGPPPAPSISLPAPPPGIPVPPDILDLNPDTVGSIEQHIAALNSGPSISGFPQDIVSERDIGEYDPRKILEFLIQPGEEHRSMQEGTYAVITGTRLDDETQEIAKELAHILQTIDPQALFENEPWYTTRLGPAPSSAVAPFPSSYGNMTFPDLISNLDPGSQSGIDTNGKRGSSETDERWYRGQETELDPSIQHALANTFSSREWNKEWTKPEHLEGFLKGNLAPFFPNQYIDSLPWDDLTDFGKIHMYSFLMRKLHDDTWHLNSPNSDWNIRLDDAAESAEALLFAVSAIPLVNEARLMEEFGYTSIAEARDDFLAQVQYAYEKFDIRPPEDLHEWSALELANELYGLLKNVYKPYYEDKSNPENFQKAYEFIADPEFNDLYVFHPSVTIARLDGSHRTSPMELVFFVASFFIEPLDWALTIRDMINAAEDGDWEEAVLLGLVGLAPGALGRFVKRGKADEVLKANELRHADELLDEVADAPRVTSKVTTSSGSNLIKQADGLFAIPGRDATTNLSKQLEYAAKDNPSLAWKAKDPNSDIVEHAHHIVPKGMEQSSQARLILEHHSISLHSHINGVALPETVHYLTYNSDYAEAIDDAMRSMRNASREDIVGFLEEVARRLRNLDPEDEYLASNYRKDVLDWIISRGE